MLGKKKKKKKDYIHSLYENKSYFGNDKYDKYIKTFSSVPPAEQPAVLSSPPAPAPKEEVAAQTDTVAVAAAAALAAQNNSNAAAAEALAAENDPDATQKSKRALELAEISVKKTAELEEAIQKAAEADAGQHKPTQ